MKYLIGPAIGLVITFTSLFGGWLAIAVITWSIPSVSWMIIRVVVLLGTGLGLFIVASDEI